MPREANPAMHSTSTAAPTYWPALNTALGATSCCSATAPTVLDTNSAMEAVVAATAIQPATSSSRMLSNATIGSARTTIGATTVTGANASARICSTAHANSTTNPRSHNGLRTSLPSLRSVRPLSCVSARTPSCCSWAPIALHAAPSTANTIASSIMARGPPSSSPTR